MTATVRAVSRLSMRPQAVGHLFGLALMLWFPFLALGLRVGEDVDLLQRPYIGWIAWGEVFTLMPMAATMVTSTLESVLTRPLLITTPDLLKSILYGRLGVGLLFSAAVAIGIAATGTTLDLVPGFACAYLFYLLGLNSSDSLTPRNQKLLTSAFEIALVFGIPSVVILIQGNRLVVPIVALAAAVFLTRRELSPIRARERVFQAPVPLGYLVGPSLARGLADSNVTAYPFRHHPSNGSIADWLAAIEYETFGARKLGGVKYIAGMVIVFCGLAYFFSNAGLPAILGLMTSSVTGRFRGTFPYPISRDRMATLIFVNGVLRYSGYYLAATVLWSLLIHSGIPRTSLAFTGQDSNGLFFMGAAFLWTPLAQWLVVKLDLYKGRSRAQFSELKAAVLAFATIIPATATAIFLEDAVSDQLLRVLVMLTVTAVGHGLLWIGLRRHFARADLV